MSDPKKCDWCGQDKPPSAGQWRNGQWLCFSCFPKNARFINCTRKCDLCKGKANQGTVVGKNFYCTSCSGSPAVEQEQKFTKQAKKKKGKNWTKPVWKVEPHVGAQQKKKDKKHKQAVQAEPEVKIEKWKVVIEDISTGDL